MRTDRLPVASWTEALQQNPLLFTRLIIPTARAAYIARPRLLERLDRGLGGRPALVSAPSGFGKSTLLSAWAAGGPWPAAWLSLDKDDSDPAVLFAHLVAACRTWRPGVGAAALEALRAFPVSAGEAPVVPLAEELAELPGDRLMVLDNAHRIDGPEAHRALAMFLARVPPHVHVALSLRGEPPSALDDWRRDKDPIEIRADELRFTLAEANAFFNQGMRLGLEPEAVALLAARTEGWIAALQLAALALQPPARSSRADVAQFIQECASQDCFILDYLAARTLALQPERVRAFLLQTSILKQLCGPLCEAVTDEPGGQALLDVLDRLSMFLTPLDEERRWFRYHPLFADLLYAQLEATWPEQVAPLHARAAGWYAAQGFGREAARHAARAG